MIKREAKLSSEFRLGNWVYSYVGTDCGDLPIPVRITKIEEGTAFVPIELTPEILEKAGFEKINHINGYSFWSFKKKGGVSLAVYDRHTTFSGFHVQHTTYVHQLQNLYFALTGEELTLTLT